MSPLTTASIPQEHHRDALLTLEQGGYAIGANSLGLLKARAGLLGERSAASSAISGGHLQRPMKLSILIAAAAISTLTLGTLAEAQTTAVWIPVYRRKFVERQSGTSGDNYYKPGVGGYAIFVDARSIIKRGPFAYFNYAGVFVNSQGQPLAPIALSDINGKQVNCKKQSSLSPSQGVWVKWEKGTPWELEGKFVCR